MKETAVNGLKQRQG